MRARWSDDVWPICENDSHRAGKSVGQICLQCVSFRKRTLVKLREIRVTLESQPLAIATQGEEYD